jgi:hypothetical protein
MIARIRFLVLAPVLIAAASPCIAQGKPPASDQQAAQRGVVPAPSDTPATQPVTVRQRLASAVEVTKALLPRCVTVEPGATIKALGPASDGTARAVHIWAGTAEPDLPPEREPAGPGGRGDVKKRRFPQHRDIMAYLNSRPWAMAYIVQREVRQAIPPTVPNWPAAADADALGKLLKDTDPAIRGLAVEALAALERPEDIPAIAELLADDHDALPALLPNMSMSAADFGSHRFDKAVTPEDATTLRFSWNDRKVKDYAVTALYIMTGETLSADSFAAWWPDHKDARNCVWYWHNRVRRACELTMLDTVRKNGGVFTGDLGAVRKAAENAVLADLEKCPKETQAKVRLMCGLDLTPLPNLISRERAFDLLDRKDLWPDLVWEFRKIGRASDYTYYGNLSAVTNGLASQATRLFRPEDANRLLAIRDRNLADKLPVGQASLTIAASRLMPPAGPGKLDDPGTRDGLLRGVLAPEQKKEEGAFRAAVAAELMNVALSANWEFLKAQFFRETVNDPGAPPAPRWTILYRLGQAPLTAEKRAALIDLLTDKRADALIPGPDPAGARGLLYPAVNAINWYAGKTLIPASLSSRLADPQTSPAAMAEFRKAIAELKALPPPQPATQPAAPGKS